MSKPVPARIAVCIWDQGDHLAGVLDEKALGRVVKIKGVVLLERLKSLFSTESLTPLVEAVSDDEVDRILWIGRFDQRQQKRIVCQLAEYGQNRYLHTWLDLEAQGVLHKDLDIKAAKKKTQILIKMALAELKLKEALKPVSMPGSDQAVVIGAGMAGLKAAQSLAGMGKKVALVERNSGVGGKVALLSRFYPLGCDPRCGLEETIAGVTATGKVAIHTLSQISKLDGAPGNFSLTLDKQPRYVNEECNGCGKCLEVCPIDLPAHLDKVQTGPPTPGDGPLSGYRNRFDKAIHPARPLPHPITYQVEREYCPPDCRACEEVCPNHAVELEQEASQFEIQAGTVLLTTGWDPYPMTELREYGYGLSPRVVGNLEMETLLREQESSLEPAWQELAFIQCAGSRDLNHLPYCSSYCCSATLKQIRQVKALNPQAKCTVFYHDIRTPGFEEDLYNEVRGMDGVTFIKGMPSHCLVDESGKVLVRAEDVLSGVEIKLSPDFLVLAGGMQPASGTAELAETLGLPLNEYGFYWSHGQCHPEESQRSGIRSGGCAQGPMNVGQSISSAQHGALMGLPHLDDYQIIEPLHPVVDNKKCDQCKRCVEECPFQAYGYDDKGYPRLNLTKCRQCGNCMGSCPVTAISLRNNTIKQYAAMLDVLGNGSFLSRKEPIVVAFMCRNDAWLTDRAAREAGLDVPPNLITLPVTCAGAVNNAVVAEALSLGVDGVFIGGCYEEECHYLSGSSLVRQRSTDLADKLEKMRMEPERVTFASLRVNDIHKYARVMREYLDALREMGPNPFKM